VPLFNSKRERQTEYKKVVFSKHRYDQHLSAVPKAAAVAAKLVPSCNFWVLVNLVRNSLPEHGRRLYDILRESDAQKKSELECAISGFHAAARMARHAGDTDAAARWESEASHFSEILKRVESDSRPKVRGALHGKKLPGAMLYLVYLEEYITVKTAIRPLPSETAHIVSALLCGLDRYPNEGIDADLLSQRLKKYREQNPLDVEDMKRKTKRDSSGQNELDRRLGKPAPGDQI
jgi:hypothetical protein